MVVFRMVKWWNKEELRKGRSPAWNLGGSLVEQDLLTETRLC
jgi:hypothetical protein